MNPMQQQYSSSGSNYKELAEQNESARRLLAVARHKKIRSAQRFAIRHAAAADYYYMRGYQSSPQRTKKLYIIQCEHIVIDCILCRYFHIYHMVYCVREFFFLLYILLQHIGSARRKYSSASAELRFNSREFFN